MVAIVVIATATAYFDDSTGTEDELVFSHQFGADIREYSSQYGSVEGVSYTAKNLVGTVTRYPAYGDYPETYVPVMIKNICYTFSSYSKYAFFIYSEHMVSGGKKLLVPLH